MNMTYDPVSGPVTQPALQPTSKEDVLAAQQAAAEAVEEPGLELNLEEELIYPMGIEDEVEVAAEELPLEDGDVPPEEGDQVVALRAALAEMQAELAELKAQRAAAPVEENFPDIVGEDEDVTEITSDRAAYNAKQRQLAAVVEERILRKVAGTMGSMVSQTVTMQQDVNTFYRQNPDLVSVKGYVGKVANAVASQHQDWTLAKVLNETNRVVRQNLKLAAKRKSSPTGFPGGTRSTVQGPRTMSGIAREIAELKAAR